MKFAHESYYSLVVNGLSPCSQVHFYNLEREEKESYYSLVVIKA